MQNSRYDISKKLFDMRVGYEPLFESGVKNIQIGADGITPVIPVEDINSIIIENEQLRETLYTEQNNLHQNLYDSIVRNQNASMKTIQSDIRYINSLTKGALSERHIYSFIYSLILPQDFKNYQAPNETILNVCWKLGYLPIMSAYLTVLSNVVRQLVLYGGFDIKKAFSNITQTVKKRVEYKNKH